MMLPQSLRLVGSTAIRRVPRDAGAVEGALHRCHAGRIMLQG